MNIFKKFKIKRLKRLAVRQYKYVQELVDEFGCGHNVAIQMSRYNNAYTNYLDTMSELKKIDPDFPEE